MSNVRPQELTVKNGASFEDYIHYVYNTLLNLKGEQVQVSKRTTFRLPSGETYEVDIYYEFMHVGVRHRVAIECKDWKQPVDQGRILEFHQKIKNIGNEVVGVFVSRVGYQSGATRVAERHGIRALTADDVPSLFDILASSIRTAFIPDSRCVGEPFWYIAELSADPGVEGTGTYYAFPESSPLNIPLFISRRHAETYWSYLPDKANFGVFGMPQYKLRALVGLALKDCLKFGLVFGPPFENGAIKAIAIDAQQLKRDYLLAQYHDAAA
jgi:Restriction endonuclease